jgi:hypothetical protein
MRLRELEVLEKVATRGKLRVMLSEQGLADREREALFNALVAGQTTVRYPNAA